MARGRPRKEINKDEFENMCAILCTEEEICSILGVSDSTLSRWCKATYGENFEDIYKKLTVGGKKSLRRNLFHLSETNASTAIFLAKNYLGMSDEPQQNKAEYEDLKPLADLLKEDED